MTEVTTDATDDRPVAVGDIGNYAAARLVIFSVKIHVKLSHRLAICRENVQHNRV